MSELSELREIAGSAAGSDADLVMALRGCREDGDTLGAQDLTDELLTMLLAGHETTAMTLTWAWWLLDRHTTVTDRMRAELRAALGTRPPAYDDLSALPYTTAVVAETLRLRPPAWIIERQVTGDCELAGLRPPRGTILLVSPWLLHRDPKLWREPDRFLPERWLGAGGRYDEAAPGQPRGAYLPFGAGSHVCVGASFAWAEAVLVLATLARSWRPSGIADELPTRAAVTLRPAHPARMRITSADEGAGIGVAAAHHDGDTLSAAGTIGT